MNALVIAGFATLSLLPLIANAQSAKEPTPLPEIKVGTMAPGDGSIAMRDARIDLRHGDWWKPSDYPRSEFASRHSGETKLDVWIGPDDKVRSCAALAESSKAFSDAGCAIVSRGNFVHALNVEGKPAAGRLTVYVSFALREPGAPSQIPPAPVVMPITPYDRDPITPNAYVVRGTPLSNFPNRSPLVRLAVSGDGSVRECMIAGSTGTDAGDIMVCDHVMSLRFPPADGYLRMKHVTLRIEP